MKLTHLSSTQPREKIVRIAESIIQDLEIKIPVHLIYQDCWSEFDSDTGEIIPNTERHDISHDGIAQDDGIVRVCINPSLMVFPAWWDINSELKNFYLRRIGTFYDIDEMILYYISHEFHHLFGYEHPREIKTMSRIAKCDEETLADFYALRNLSKKRTNDSN